MDAVFKRASFLVNSKEHLYFRPAGINTDPVQRISMPICEYLTEEGRQVYGAFKAGNKEMPNGFEEEVLKEQQWVSTIMDKLYRKRRTNPNEENMRLQIRQGLFGDQPQKEESVTEKMETHNARVKLEQEESSKTRIFKRAKVWSQELKASCSFIDLDSDNEGSEAPNPRTSSSASVLPNPNDEIVHEEYPDVFGFENGIDTTE